MIPSIVILLLCQRAGETLRALTYTRMSSSVFGLTLLTDFPIFRRKVSSPSLQQSADGLLKKHW